MAFGWISFTVVSCGGGGGGDDLPAPVSLSGRVTGSGGIQGVNVVVVGTPQATDESGYFSLPVVPYPAGGILLVTFEKEGYATGQRRLDVVPGGSYFVTAKLLAYGYDKSGVDPGAESEHEAEGGAVRLVLPAGSVADPQGGKVRVEMAYGDPSTEEGRSAFPGDFMGAPAQGAAEVPLESVAFAEITIEDSGGKDVKRLEQPAQVRLRLPDEFQQGGEREGTYDPVDPGRNRIPWWSYDESGGRWVREDADPSTPGSLDDAQIVSDGGMLYAQAAVVHLTWWNVDHPLSEHACLCVKVVNGQGAPLSGIAVTAQGVTYNGVSSHARTDSLGRACVNVKRSVQGAPRERVKVVAMVGSTKIYYDVTSASEGNVASDEVYTPIQQGSTLGSGGQCADLMNAIQVDLKGCVEGVVVWEGSSWPLQFARVWADSGDWTTTDTKGRYRLEIPLGVEVTIHAPRNQEKPARTSYADPLCARLDFVIPDAPPEITSLTKDKDGVVCRGAEVRLEAEAFDPDGGDVTYSWTATAGAVSPASGWRMVTWTAPSQSSGTATVTVTVTDDEGRTASRSTQIPWGRCEEVTNRAPVIQSLTAEPAGKVCPGQTVKLTVDAFDPDGDDLTYCWEATAGLLSPACPCPTGCTQSTVTWTAPASGSGTAVVTVTVRDEGGLWASRSITLEWGDTGSCEKLVLRFIDDCLNKEPQRGVHVVLHGPDDVTIARYIQTGQDGVADLGRVGRDRVTLTIGYEAEVQYRESYGCERRTKRKILTLVHVKAGQYTFSTLGTPEIDDLVEGELCCEDPTVPVIDVTLASVPPYADKTVLAPFIVENSDDRQTFNFLRVCPFHLQSDGRLSLLGIAFDYDGVPVEYGFRYDLEVTDGAEAIVELNQVPGFRPWSADTDLDQIEMAGFRKGVPYHIGSLWLDSPKDSGDILVLDKLGADEYIVHAQSHRNDSWGNKIEEWVSQTRLQALPSSLQIRKPGFRFSEASFDSATRTFRWSLVGGSAVDHLTIEDERANSDTEPVVSWSAVLAPTETYWKLPQLPAALEDWLEEPSNWRKLFAQAQSWDVVNGWDEVLRWAATECKDPDDSAKEYYSVELRVAER